MTTTSKVQINSGIYRGLAHFDKQSFGILELQGKIKLIPVALLQSRQKGKAMHIASYTRGSGSTLLKAVQPRGHERGMDIEF